MSRRLFTALSVLSLVVVWPSGCAVPASLRFIDAKSGKPLDAVKVDRMQVSHGLFGLVTERKFVEVGTSVNGTIPNARLVNDDVLRVERLDYQLMLLRIAAGGAAIIKPVPVPPAENWQAFLNQTAEALMTDREYDAIGYLKYHDGRNLTVPIQKLPPSTGRLTP